MDKNKHLTKFTPSHEIQEGSFVAILALDEELEIDDQDGPIWVAKVVQISRVEEGIATRFIALWYKPKPSKGLPKRFMLKELYDGCLLKKQEWVPNNDT